MRERLLVAAALVAAACTGTSGRTAYESALDPDVERVFVAPELFANRLFDWRLAGGRIECLEGARRWPMRTLHLLSARLGGAAGELEMQVRTGPLAEGDAAGEDTWSGFLVGAGDGATDHRVSALVHHWPAPGGGLIAALDGTGRLVLRDNEGSGEGRRGPVGDLTLAAWPLLARDDAAEPLPANLADGLVLRLSARPEGDAYRLDLAALDSAGEVLRSVSLAGVDAGYLEGNVALVSHGSRSDDGPGYWFEGWRVGGTKVEQHPRRGFGPVVAAQYTVSRGVLKLTAQMAALGPQDTREAALEVRRAGGRWEHVATGRMDPQSWTVPFRVEPWDASREAEFRVLYRLRDGTGRSAPHAFEGRIRAEPSEDGPLVLAAFTGHHVSARGDGSWTATGFWFPHGDLTSAVAAHDPDLLFFSGDQIYESGLAGIVRSPVETALLDYQYHWYLWCWAFRDLARERPTICLPDDHDVYHGNLWGAGGVKAEGPLRPRGDNGGYVMEPSWVNAVHATQTSHLPDPADPAPVAQGISVYFTDLVWGPVSFAVLADRQWKDSASVEVPEGKVVNGWFQNRSFDPVRDADVSGAQLLGPRQEAFLERWAADWAGGVRMKAMLSQTILANVATLPEEAAGDGVVPSLRYAEPGEYIEGDRLAADADSNGWPQAARNRALRAARKGFAFHVAGDQHLASFVQYGVDEWGDAANAFCVPSVANFFPRRWYPPQPGANRLPGAPDYTGDFRDGFGNLLSVRAVANPRRSGREPAALHDRMPGYGIVRFDVRAGTITAECWPRWAHPDDPAAVQYDGWPVTVDMLENYGREPVGHLPEIEVVGLQDPVVQVVDELTGEVVYTVRRRDERFALPVFEQGDYTVRVGEPGTPRWREVEHLRAGEQRDRPVRVELGP